MRHKTSLKFRIKQTSLYHGMFCELKHSNVGPVMGSNQTFTFNQMNADAHMHPNIYSTGGTGYSLKK